jgi:predicted phage terminase large subunit-like protein
MQKISKADQIALLEEYAVRKSRTDYFTFLKYLFPSNVVWNWHHEAVCNILNDFVKDPDFNRLMIFMPPQHQKSTMMTEYLPPFAFGNNPNMQTILTMYNATLAAKYNRKIQRIIDSEKYKKVFPSVRLNEKNVVTTVKGSYVRNSEEFEIVGHQGFMKTVGVGGGIAGTPAKLALLDDVIKSVEEANSITFRNKTYDWYTDELEARLHNDSKVAFTITRRHEDDLAGRLLDRDGTVEEGGKWRVIKLEAIKETHESDIDPRNIGEALFPDLHSLERLEEIRSKSVRTFTSLYQQRPAPLEGTLIRKDYFDIVERLPAHNGVFNAYIDTAYTAKQQNDPSAILLAITVDNLMYVVRYAEVRAEFSELCDYIDSMMDLYGNAQSRIKIEPKANGKSVVQYLRKQTKLNVIEYIMPEGDKIARTNANQPIMEARRVKLLKGSWNASFLDALAMFPNAKHDEAVDCLNMAIEDELKRTVAKKRRAAHVG